MGIVHEDDILAVNSIARWHIRYIVELKLAFVRRDREHILPERWNVVESPDERRQPVLVIAE